MTKTALVTGSEGFVGKHMVRALTEAGWEVTRLDIVKDSYTYDLKWLHWDARDYFRERDEQFDLVVHLAAIVGGRAKIEGAPMEVAVDLSIDAEMFNWAVRTKPGRVVYYSSSAAYPTILQRQGVYTRLHEGQIGGMNLSMPDQTYGWVKLTGEVLAEHVRAAGVPVTVLRPFSGYGPGQSLDYPFPSFIDRARRRADPFEIWGDGRQVRDWVHIDDIIDTTMFCIDAGYDDSLNIGTGIGTSFLELKDKVCLRVGFDYDPEVKPLGEKPVGVSYRVADPSLLASVFRLPKVSLDEGIWRALKDD